MNAKKIVAALLAAVLLIGIGVGGTLAWLMDSTETITNTFSTSDIEVGLKETTTNYQMIPGHTIAKDPKAWVDTGSVPALLFVKVEKSSNFDTYMEAEINTPAWTELTSAAGTTYKVYYTYVNGADAMGEGEAISILKDDEVKVKDTVTKEMMNALTADNYPKLTFTAYAHQLYKNDSGALSATFTAEEAWANLNPPATP